MYCHFTSKIDCKLRGVGDHCYNMTVKRWPAEHERNLRTAHGLTEKNPQKNEVSLKIYGHSVFYGWIPSIFESIINFPSQKK